MAGDEFEKTGPNDEPVSETAASERMAADSAQHAAPASPKRKHRKGLIALGVIIAVVVVAGIGFFIWHEQPSFCNAICHSPMDYYVQTYDDRDPHNGVTVHAEAGENCLSCHVPTLAEQLTEVIAWTSDTYPMTADGTMLASGKEFATEEFCARAGCHAAGDTMTEITAATWGFAGNEEIYNPHSSHQDLALKCYDCHGVHDGNILVCNECHALNMPEGWEAPNA